MEKISMDTKLIVTEQIYNIKTKSSIKVLELWEDEFSGYRKMYQLGDTDWRNRYIDEFSSPKLGVDDMLRFEINGFKFPKIERVEDHKILKRSF